MKRPIDDLYDFSRPTTGRRRAARTRNRIARILFALTVLFILTACAVFAAEYLGIGSTTYASTGEVTLKPPLPEILKRIAFCESSGQQYEADGTVRVGKVDKEDRGLWQINSRYHGAEAKALGYDIETPQGNEDMARYLLAHEGTAPWSASRKCWQ